MPAREERPSLPGIDVTRERCHVQVQRSPDPPARRRRCCGTGSPGSARDGASFDGAIALARWREPV